MKSYWLRPRGKESVSCFGEKEHLRSRLVHIKTNPGSCRSSASNAGTQLFFFWINTGKNLSFFDCKLSWRSVSCSYGETWVCTQKWMKNDRTFRFLRLSNFRWKALNETILSSVGNDIQKRSDWDLVAWKKVNHYGAYRVRRSKGCRN